MTTGSTTFPSCCTLGSSRLHSRCGGLGRVLCIAPWPHGRGNHRHSVVVTAQPSRLTPIRDGTPPRRRTGIESSNCVK